MKRRHFITLLGGAAVVWPLAARAQQSPAILRVGLVGVQPRTTAIYVAFLQRMAELGYEEGKNFVLDYVQVPNIEGYERGYQELAGRKVDILFASGPEIGLKSALAATGTQPIVMVAVDYESARTRLCDKPRATTRQPHRHLLSANRTHPETSAACEGGISRFASGDRILGQNICRPMARSAIRRARARAAACRHRVPRAAL
jgi:hypothetical protein